MPSLKTSPITILGGRLTLHQDLAGFHTTLDAVLLAAACPVQASESVLDLGCGVGSAGLAVLSRVPTACLTGIDIQEHVIALARKNADMNHMTTCTLFDTYDVRALRDDKHISFDHVICNPPYLPSGTYLPADNDQRAKAMGHRDTDLKDWVDAGFYALKNSGSLTLIHRADQLDKIFYTLGKRFGAIEIFPLWPKQGQPAKRVIVRALKNRKTPTTIHHGLILHKNNGDYTIEAEKILRDGGALF